MGVVLQRKLHKSLGDEKHVGEIRGGGLFYAVEFVKDRKTKKSFDPKIRFGQRVQQRALDLGIAVYPGSGTVDGVLGDHVIVAPPYTITPEELELIVKTLLAAYRDVVAELARF